MQLPRVRLERQVGALAANPVEGPPALLGQTAAYAAPLAAPRREQARRLGRLILVAEDNEFKRTVIAQQLRRWGFAADIAANGLKALETWRSGDFGLVLTDLHMPELDGYALAASIRAEEGAGRRTPIVALTANALHDEKTRCLAAGMDVYLSKPARLAHLKETLQAGLAGTLWQPQRMPQAPGLPASTFDYSEKGPPQGRRC